MIRRMRDDDLPAVARLWLEANLDAHSFIPSDYWQGQLARVRSMLPLAEVYVHETASGRGIDGFLGLSGGHIQGLFVRREARCGGIGKALLDAVKARCPRLTLQVYRDNPRAAAFYRREGFRVLEEGVDEDTGRAEYLMVWER